MSAPLLALDKVEVVYKSTITAVQGVTLAVAPGQIVVVLGTNGAGKTTLLRAISGFLGLDDARVTEGAIAFKGSRIENRPPHAVTRLGIALVPERDKVFPNLTVAENLIAPVAHGLGTAERRRREAMVYQFFPQLANLRGRIGGLLSGGERQMLALGSAIVCRPELLLVDELSLGLAPVIVEDLMRRVVEIRRELGISVLMVEQSAAAALEICDYGYVLENGRVVLDGDGARLRGHRDIQEFYLGQVAAASAAATAPSSNTAAAGGGMAELNVERLTLSFGGLAVLNQVSFAIEAGELFALIGPNGAGKTSVLNCISGIYRGQGRVDFRSTDISGLSPHEIARLGLARTFQHGELFPQMTVLDNLLTGRHARIGTNALAEMFFLPAVRRAEEQHRGAVERILEFVELERYRHAPVAGLPFGIQKIVGFARALALEPALMMLDEPSAGLNRDEREDLARFILRIKHELGIAMIWIEHDMQMVADLADRIHVLNYGRTLAEGAPGDVLKDERVIAAYIGRAGAS